MCKGLKALAGQDEPAMTDQENPLWNIYENASESVYICTVDTHELLYMNRRLRELMGFDSHQAYKCKKCYEVIQGLKEPCPFCTNDKLTNGDFYSWVHYNPILKQRFLLKDALFSLNGAPMRIEFASEIDQDVSSEDLPDPSMFHHSEAVSSCIRYAQDASTPDDVVRKILDFSARTFGCKSAASFSVTRHGVVCIEYKSFNPDNPPGEEEACADAEILPYSELWGHMLETGSGVAMSMDDEEAPKYPVHGAIAQKYHISNLAIEPLKDNGKIIGFIGGYNIPKSKFAAFVSFLATISFIVANMYKQRDAQRKLEAIGFTDLMTGSNNRNAFLLRVEQLQGKDAPMGVVACDIPNVEAINNAMGRVTGDEHIKICYQQICKVFHPSTIYRMDGNEFLVLKCNIRENILRQKVERLRRLTVKAGVEMSIGMAWNEHGNLHEVIRSADNAMRSDKQATRADHKLPQQSAREPRNQLIAKEHVTVEDFLEYVYEGNYHISSLMEAFSDEAYPYGVVLGDLKSNLFYISNSMREKFGIQEQIIPHFFSIWAKRIEMPGERRMYVQCIQEMISGQQSSMDVKCRVRDQANQLIWIRYQANIQRDEDGTPLFYTGFISWQDQEFCTDLITGFAKDISALNALSRIQESGTPHTAVAFSPSNIRELNETRGRARTDQILRDIASALSNQLGRDVLFFRLDGVRFLGLAEYVDEQSEQEVLQGIREVVNRVYYAYDIPVPETCTLSLLHYPCDMDPKEFLGASITSLRVAKQKKAKTLVKDSMDTVRQCHDVSAMALALSRSVMDDFAGFRVVVQPIVCAQSGRIEKGEVLLRWHDGEKTVSPGVFIPILEETDLIIPVGKWVFEQTVKLLQTLMHRAPDFRLAFNVSYQQIADDEFLDFMEQTLQKYPINPHQLTMELTESHLNDHPQHLTAFMDRCHQLGIAVALDDFGNGYSSLGLLMKYPADIIKLDKSIIETMSVSQNNLKFIRSIIYACHEFGRQVICEGVETEEERDLVRQAGSDMIQGYYYYKPLEVADLQAILITR